ncbi:hypothetical protein [Thalassomonas sp. RHCl1]|uniref:hypothetical protein n=1 Tax=Thalassomonas sp. RHCl1 TaxID=2995320 RepID=UPI00248C1FA1|nr:hypothetical protein [Thalassomonas sp. RHCl1]
MKKFAIFLAFLSAAHASMAKSKPNDLVGEWLCEPYQMNNDALKITVVDERSFNEDGNFLEISNSTIVSSSGEKVLSKVKYLGSWELNEQRLKIIFDNGEVLSLDSINYSVEDMQKSVNAQLNKKNWSDSIIFFNKNSFTTKPVNSMYKEAEVNVTCNRKLKGTSTHSF